VGYISVDRSLICVNLDNDEDGLKVIEEKETFTLDIAELHALAICHKLPFTSYLLISSKNVMIDRKARHMLSEN
jgi:hypothetical protein